MRKPNIILMISHDSGKYFGCYGKDVETPNLDQLSKEGIRFNNYFCPAPQCSPSRGSILTGLYPHNHGMMGLAHLGFHLNKNVTTFPMELNNNGYETSLIGFSHETIGETEYGMYSSTYKLGYERYRQVKGNRASEVADSAIEFIKEKSNNLSNQPFFANVGFWETHRPFDEYEPCGDNIENVQVPPYLPNTQNVRRDFSQFHGSLKALDQAVGRILRTFKSSKLEENTIFIYTTDHGIPFPRAKGTLKEAGLETALVFYNPWLFGSGRVSNELLCNIDLMPTLLELAGLSIPQGLDGKSFASLLKGRDTNGREEFFCELTWHDRYHPMRGIRTNRYKYIKNFEEGPKIYMPVDIHTSLSGLDVRKEFYIPNDSEELYDLESDPLEKHNLLVNPSYTNIVKELREKVKNWMEITNDPLLHGPVPGIEAPEWNENVPEDGFE